MLYGADLSLWPIVAGNEARGLLKAGGDETDELNALIEEEGEFEALLSERSFEEPGDYLAQRIIANAGESAFKGTKADPVKGLLSWLVAEFFTPRAAIALALTLVIGFMAGYMAPQGPEPFDQLVLDDEMMLEETFSSLFMEGDIFE